MPRPTQTELILAALKRGERLTALDGINRFGCMRFAARIHELRKAGWAIEDDTVARNGKRFSEYYMNGREWETQELL